MKSYSCSKCPGYCCSYPEIEVTKGDIARLAKHFGITTEQAESRFTKGERLLRHQKDRIFDTVCMFLDQKTRRCTVYEARPGVCLSLIHISEPTRLLSISYAVFCLK